MTHAIDDMSLFIHNSLNSKESEFVFNKGHVESVWAEVKLTETEILLCGIVYKSQKEKENDILHDLFMSVSKLKNYTHLLIMGDFNYSEIGKTGPQMILLLKNLLKLFRMLTSSNTLPSQLDIKRANLQTV